ncbi:hypothetical protein AVEN_8305-1 [Araneus ventricosus]|uniref:Uncharacterized protein n=1 Tax=Araneus ventricosus TaxID=182803 RepID=A0A4Y2T4K4_ARAVE|nr:hypothetical protein AVEN_8305-1 [Araneus ventricosus]
MAVEIIPLQRSLIFKLILRPILMWVLAAPTDKKKMQVIQNNLLRIVRNVPWYIRNDIIHSDLDIETMDEYMSHLSRKFFIGTVNHSNDLIASEISFTSNNGKITDNHTT